MSTRTAPPPAKNTQRRRRAPKPDAPAVKKETIVMSLHVGDKVVCTTGKLRGVDPFTALKVTAINAAGKEPTVDLAAVARGDARTFTKVDPRNLTKLK